VGKSGPILLRRSIAIVADCDRLEWVRFSKDHLTKAAARVLMSCWIRLRLERLELLA
jgi:hypothetical protein